MTAPRARTSGAPLASPGSLGYQTAVSRRLPEPAGPMLAGDVVVHSSSDLEHADDEALARALVAKQAHAARLVWQRFSPMVRRIIRRTLGPAGDAEDLLQDVFMQLFAKAHTLREPKVLEAFIISITTLTLRQELRRRKVRSWLGFGPDPASLDLRVVHPDPIGREALVRFYALLDRLDVRDRTAFALRVIDGLDLNEVALALGVSLATAKRCLARAKQRMLLHVERDPLLADYLAAAFREADRE